MEFLKIIQDQFLSGVVEEFYLNSYLQFQLFENLKSNKF